MKYFKEHGYFFNSDGVKSTFLTRKGRKLEFEVGTVMPKQVKVPFMFYHSEYFAQNKKSIVEVTAAEVSKRLGANWNALDETQKQKYIDLNKKDKERYERELSELRSKGFFTNQDGVKSTSLPPPSPKKKRSASKPPQAPEPAAKKAKI